MWVHPPACLTIKLGCAEVLEKALVPELQSMSRQNRQQVLHFIRSRWMSEDKISEDQAFVKALSEVISSEVLAKTSF